MEVKTENKTSETKLCPRKVLFKKGWMVAACPASLQQGPERWQLAEHSELRSGHVLGGKSLVDHGPTY